MLSQAIAEIQATETGEEYNLAMDLSGECGEFIHNAIIEQREHIATKYGFANYEALLAEIEKRTSFKWVAQNMPC